MEPGKIPPTTGKKPKQGRIPQRIANMCLKCLWFELRRQLLQLQNGLHIKIVQLDRFSGNPLALLFWLVFAFVMLSLALHLDIKEWFAAIGEVLVALVIYYEIEEHRVTGFLEAALDTEGSKERLDIYKAFAERYHNQLLVEGAEKFAHALLRDPDCAELRRKVDSQLNQLARFRYSLRYSVFHRNVMVAWFPHVLVRLWLMLGPYADRREPPGNRLLYGTVLRSAIRLIDAKRLPQTIYVIADKPLEILLADVEHLRDDLISKIKQLDLH